MFHDSRYEWRPSYEVKRGKSIDIKHAGIDECPTGFVEDWAIRTVHVYLQQMALNKAGGCLFGSDSSRWPAKWADAIQIFEAETAFVDSTMHAKLTEQ